MKVLMSINGCGVMANINNEVSILIFNNGVMAI
jgi:hypothetical protein